MTCSKRKFWSLEGPGMSFKGSYLNVRERYSSSISLLSLVRWRVKDTFRFFFARCFLECVSFLRRSINIYRSRLPITSSLTEKRERRKGIRKKMKEKILQQILFLVVRQALHKQQQQQNECNGTMITEFWLPEKMTRDEIGNRCRNKWLFWRINW